MSTAWPMDTRREAIDAMEARHAAERATLADSVPARCRHRIDPGRPWPRHQRPGWHAHEDDFHACVYKFILDDATSRILGLGLNIPAPPALPRLRTSQAKLNYWKRIGLI